MSKGVIIVCCLVAVLSGCDSGHRHQLECHKCSVEQLKMVELEVAMCTDKGDFRQVCYKSMRIAHCDLIHEPTKEQDDE